MKKIFSLTFLLWMATSVFAQIQISGVINKYSPVTSFTCDKIVVENGILFTAGDRVLIIQMKGAKVDTTNTANFGSIIDYRSAGNYEFNTVKSISGNTITLQFALKKSYETTGNVQLIYVPVYTDVTVSGKISGSPWDGKKGGVIAMEVSGTLTLNADIDASGIGFRGGKVRVDPMPLQFCAPNVIFGAYSKNEGGQKGEGIAVWDSLKLTHKGAWANGGGGGNDANAGGGGGANGGNGGRGGKLYYEPNNQPNCQGGHGIGGKSLNSSFSISKLFLGGGGGAGHDNDNVGSSGANGGGLIIIKATTINGNNFQIISKGMNAQNAGNDGAGGGGGGGTIAISATSINSCKLISDGGNGGNNTWTTFNQCHGTGGGGGGGTILHNANLNLTTLSFIQGIAGRLAFTNPPAPCTNINFEAEAGISGNSINSLQLSYSDKIQASNIDSTSTNIALCNNENYTLPDGTITNQPGTYRNILKNIAGCDSILVKTTITQATNCANTISGVINKYSPVTSFTCDKIVVENGTLFTVGDRVLIIQMKGAKVDTTNTANFGSIIDYRSAGNYEFNTVKSISGNTIILQFALKKSYETTGNVQLIYVPVYTDVTVSGKISGSPWDGKKGGVIAMEVSGTLTLNADIDASGIGFRGGPRITSSFPPPYCVPNIIFAPLLNPNGGHKGEGIAKWDSLKILNKGAWANGGGGGNNHNAGGGGGANAGIGGRGGKIYSDVNLQTCLGGHGLPGNKIIQNTNKLFLGGGGGAGHENDNVGSAGGNGGGLIIINATAISGNGKKIISNGSTALNTRNDGAGGGGAGGTIALQANAIASVFFEAIGGNGGNNQWQQPEQCVAPGGGGGGGLIFSNQNIDTSFIKVSNGLAGIITAPTSGCYNSNFEAENGATGTSLRNLQLSYSDKIQASNIDSTSTNIALCNNENYTLPDGTITNQPGTYRNVLKNIAGCDSIIIKTNLSYAFKPSFSLGNDTVLCLGTEITLNPGVNGDYTWQDGSTANVYEAIVPGIYSLSVSNDCGATSDTISFQGIDCNCFVFIPNAFSPNNDGKNDNLIIKETGITGSTFIIYSKWGEEVFSTNNNERQWDGTIDGKSPQPDVYGYYYRGVCFSGAIIIRKGDITIVK